MNGVTRRNAEESGAFDEGPVGVGRGPLHTTLELDGLDGGCIAEARDRAELFLTRVQAAHGVPVTARTMDLTRLVVSELVTNACKYAPGPVLLRVEITGEAVEVEVWDSDPALPLARAADPGRVGQHGLEIVMAVVQGFEARREPVGKCITARIALWDDPVGGLTGPASD